MSDSVDALVYRAKAISYWERRRRIFLGLLVVPTLGGFFLTSEVVGSFDDPVTAPVWFTVMQFGFAFVGANVAFSLVYVLEFGFMGTRWQQAYCGRRRSIFLVGCLLGLVLAANMAHQFALDRYTIRLPF